MAELMKAARTEVTKPLIPIWRLVVKLAIVFTFQDECCYISSKLTNIACSAVKSEIITVNWQRMHTFADASS